MPSPASLQSQQKPPQHLQLEHKDPTLRHCCAALALEIERFSRNGAAMHNTRLHDDAAAAADSDAMM